MITMLHYDVLYWVGDVEMSFITGGFKYDNLVNVESTRFFS